jgi:hypothetical protein
MEVIIGDLTRICERNLLPNNVKATVREPYIPFIPEHWNGVLILAEAQNHGKAVKLRDGTLFLDWLMSLSSIKRMQRLYHNPDYPKLGNIGIQPWDDGTLKIAVEAALNINADETAVSNACLWSAPSEELKECSVRVWTDMLKILKPKKIVTAGSIANEIIVRAR